jgi:hypothetical protein
MEIIHLNISDDQNQVRVNSFTYQFRRSLLTRFSWFNACDKCDLRTPCVESHLGKIDFPFPCVPDNRKDKKGGYFEITSK